MAALTAVAVTAEVALVAATARTVLQLVAPTNHALKVLGWSVSFDGISSVAEPVVCTLIRQTTAGTMTALTPVKLDSGRDETIQATAQHTATAEPTDSDVLARRNVHPQAGYEVIYPPGQEPIVGTAGRIAVKCTAPAGVNVVAEIRFEE